MAAHDPPIGIGRDRHLELQGRSRHVWERRGALLLFAAVPILALLNVFGQATTTNVGRSPTASLTVESPSHIRSGIIFTAQITVRTTDDVKDMQLSLDRGWFESMTFNGIVPQPSNESVSNGRIIFDFGPVPANAKFPIWISLAANPTNVGRHPQSVTLSDGENEIMTVHRTLTVFP
jgi:hypothetical protein